VGSTRQLDIHESDHQYVVPIELSGVRKEDVSVEINDGILSVRGEKTSGGEADPEHVMTKEVVCAALPIH
jgi:HSP20 family protein